MIRFDKIRYKNFLSTGNDFTEIVLNSHANTLIVGANGHGKSQFMDAITFAIYGRAYRNINKPSIVNSVNKKDCLVELEFSIGTKSYLIRRGIKPTIFEIYVNGVMLNQDSRVDDYQEMLEKLILKMDFKAFTQMVVLGSASFIPFMQLSAADRRAVIEDLLDIQVFSGMSVLVKDRISKAKSTISECKIRIDSTKEKIELHKKHLEDLKRNTNDMIESKRREIANSSHTIVELDKESQNLQLSIDDLLLSVVDKTELSAKHNKINSIETKIDVSRSTINKDMAFFVEHRACPTCRQDISEDFKTSRVHECSVKLKEFESGLEKLKAERDIVVARLAEISNINVKINELGKDKANVASSVSHTKKYMGILEKEIKQLEDSKSKNLDMKDQSQELVDELAVEIDSRRVATEEKAYLEVAASLLKDGGIKTKIIKQYIPVINKFVNKYLVAMDFFVNFNIDEEFKEQIKSRHRDTFSYENFSEGEKFRIDLSLLLTWRAIARMKNSVHTNLMILDEVFDASLDTKGTDSLLEIFHNLPEDMNIFVISHKEQLTDKFDRTIRFHKKGDFSRIEI